VSLAEAVGVLRVACPEDDPLGRLTPLDVDAEALLARVEAAAGVDASAPRVGAACGAWVGGRLVSVDSLTQSYTMLRLRQLGATVGNRFAEIGGGYGCLAALMARAGHRNYTVYDLPWANAVQGYYLLMALPPGTVRLFDEPESAGPVRVLPYGEFDRAEAASVDYAVRTAGSVAGGVPALRNVVENLGRVVRGYLYSMAREPCGEGPGTAVPRLTDAAAGHFRLVSRHRAWMRVGSVEEVYVPQARAAHAAAA
jgi:hypothetical protein